MRKSGQVVTHYTVIHRVIILYTFPNIPLYLKSVITPYASLPLLKHSLLIKNN